MASSEGTASWDASLNVPVNRIMSAKSPKDDSGGCL